MTLFARLSRLLIGRLYSVWHLGKVFGLKIQQMRHFVAAADSSSFAQAAKKCFTSRQNIVHSIRELERELGVPLFERENNELSLTPSGQQVVTQAWAILREVDLLQNMFAEKQGRDMSLSFAASRNFLAGAPVAATRYLLEHVDNAHLEELGAESCYQAVCDGRVDAAFIACMARSFPLCSTIKIANEPAYILVNETSDLASKESIAAVDLLDKKLAVISRPPFQYAPLFAELESLRFKADQVDVISSERLMCDMVKFHDSVGILSKGFVDRMLSVDEGFCAVPFADQTMNWNFYALYRRNTPNFKALIRVINDFKFAFETQQMPR